MKKRLVWSDRALKDAERLDARVRARIVAALERLAETGYGDVRRLRGGEGEIRLRVGDWRVTLEDDPGADFLRILQVRRRDQAYRRS